MGPAVPERRIILIVEDDSELRRLIVLLFEERGLEIVECDSAESALATMLLRGRDVVMIFSDVRLPGAMDGLDLAPGGEGALAPSDRSSHLGERGTST
jgi:CheY-like chemotaxis protein